MSETIKAPDQLVHLLRAAGRAYGFLVQRPALNALLWFVVALLLYGVGMCPFQDYFRISQNPFATDLSASFYQDSILLPLLAYYLGLSTDPRLFIAACFLIVALTFAVFTLLARARFEPKLAAIVPMALALHPISLILLNWLGTVDGLTILLSGVLTFARSPLLIFGAAAAGVMNHPQMMPIAAFIALLRLADDNETFWPRRLLALVAGCALGYGAVQLFLHANGIETMPGRLSMMLSPGLAYWWSFRLKELPSSVFSLYNGSWFVLVVCLAYGITRRPRYYSAFLAVQLASLVLAFFTWDLTRVFGLLTAASVLHCLLFTLSLARSQGSDFARLYRIILVLLLASLFMPKYFAWYGAIVQPQTATFWKLLADAVTRLLNQYSP